MEGIVPLLDRQSEDGFHYGKNNHFNHWIGASALNSQDGPWHKLPAHGPQSDIGEGIRISFENMMLASTLIRSTPLTITFSMSTSFIMLWPLQALLLKGKSNEAL